MRRLGLTNLGSRITLMAVGICLGTILVIYLYAVAVGGAASGLSAVKGQILVGGLIALLLATAVGLYYAQMAASNIARLQEAARKVADGNFETKIPVAAAGQLGQLATAPASSSSPTPRTSCARRSSASAASSSYSRTRTPARRSGPSSCARCASRSPG
jgi:HAMP domain-containing protein